MKFSTFLTEQKSKAVGIFIGRMAPPTKAHQKIIEDALKKYSRVYIFIIEGEKSSKLAKNFLTYNQRRSIIKITNPKAQPILSPHGYIPDIIEQENIGTKEGIAIIAGSDRMDGYKKQFADVDYNVIFDEVKRTEEDVSASKVRKALGADDFKEYKRMVAKGLDNEEWFEKFRKLLKATIGRPGNVRGQLFKEERMYSIQELINEDINRHIEHFEDNMFNNGVDGIEKNIELAKLIRDTLSGDSKSKATITVKWDGAPAVFFGINPENKKFFVSTKALFNKTPKLAYTPADADEHFGHAPGLVSKLKTSLKYLSGLGVKTIYQGDLLFTDDKKTESINGVKYITFTPNTITYAVPEDSDLAQKIRRAKMGIVIHTQYTGNSLDTLSAKFNIDVSDHFNDPDVWVQDAYFRDESGTVNFSRPEVDKINELISEAERVQKYIKEDIFKKMKSFGLYELFRIFHNENIKQANALRSITSYYEDFMFFIKKRYEEQAEQLKSPEAKKKRMEMIDSAHHFLHKYKREIMGLLYLYLIFIRLKNIFVRKFGEISNIGTFIRSGDGYNVTKPEGFCVIDKSGSILKLVDRLEFSKANFTLEKNW